MKERKAKILDKILTIYSKYSDAIIRSAFFIISPTSAFVGVCIAYHLSKELRLIKLIFNMFMGLWAGGIIGTFIAMFILIFLEAQKSKRNKK